MTIKVQNQITSKEAALELNDNINWIGVMYFGTEFEKRKAELTEGGKSIRISWKIYEEFTTKYIDKYTALYSKPFALTKSKKQLADKWAWLHWTQNQQKLDISMELSQEKPGFAPFRHDIDQLLHNFFDDRKIIGQTQKSNAAFAKKVTVKTVSARRSGREKRLPEKLRQKRKENPTTEATPNTRPNKRSRLNPSEILDKDSTVTKQISPESKMLASILLQLKKGSPTSARELFN